MNKRKQVIILDIHGLIDESKGDSIQRHLKYESELSRLSNGKMQLLIVSKSNKTNSLSTLKSNSNSLNILKLTRVKYIIKSASIVRNSETGSVLICGDPWKSFSTGIIVKLLSCKRIPIQVQIHADIYDDSYARIGIKNQIKRKIAFFSLWSADSIRTVSKLQTEKMINVHPKFQDKIARASVPLNSDFLVRDPKLSTDGLIKVGVLGRIEPDRGIERLIKLSEYIVNNSERIRFILAGSGTLINHSRFSSSTVENHSMFTLLGELRSQELPQFFSEIDVLLSLAPSESFGRALRESLLAGRPVVAMKSSGVTELREYLRGESVYSVDHDISNSALVKLLVQASSKSVSQEVAKLIEEEQNQSIKSLVQSWINLSKIGSGGQSNDS